MNAPRCAHRAPNPGACDTGDGGEGVTAYSIRGRVRGRRLGLNWTRMLNRVHRYIRKHGMLKAGDRVAVAVSGGADSVALLELLLRLRDRLGITLAVAHFNHRLRGEESDQDQRFVTALAARNGLPSFTEAAGDAPPGGANIESVAREQRYAFFRRLVAGGCATKVATAHTLDDQAETVLGRLLRGSGTPGLAGIYPVWENTVIRPLLAERRAEVRAWASRQGLQWREDLSNLQLQFLRNRLRHQVLPMLERDFNPRLAAVLSETAELARAEEQFWQARVAALADQLLQTSGAGWKLALADFVQLSEAEQRRLLREALRRARGHLRQIEFSHIEEARHLALASQSGREVMLPGCRVERVFGSLLIQPCSGRAGPSSGAGYEYSVEVPGVCIIPETRTRLCFKLVDPASEAAGYNKLENLVALDSIQNPVIVRNRRPGDVFQTPEGRKKLKALLVEQRIPREQRRLWPVVASRLELVWARGLAVARPFRWSAGCGSVAGILITEEELEDAAAPGGTPL